MDWRWLVIRVISSVSLFTALVPSLHAANITYYVSPNGSDSNPGVSLDKPFRTTQKCAGVTTPGDTCLIRGGVYRETVIPARSGAVGAPIVFQAYQNKVVIISGNEVIAGWTSYSGHVYCAAMPWSLKVRTPEQITDNQLFVDGQMMVEARWSNLLPERSTRQTNGDKARSDGVGNVGQYTATYLDSALGALPAGLFDGGKITSPATSSALPSAGQRPAARCAGWKTATLAMCWPCVPT